MRWLLIALVLIGCNASPSAQLPPEELLQPCAPEGPLPPRAPPPDKRSAVNVGKWSIAVQLAREETDRQLRECARKHLDLAQWVRTKGNGQ